MKFKKRQVPWNKGISPSKKTREKISKALIGRPLAEETKIKISESLKGNPALAWSKGTKWTEEMKKKLRGRIPWNKGKPMHPNAKKALFNANWKGGKIDHDGYIRTRSIGHPRATPHGHYVFEHILVMENFLGRYLNENEIVHHVNEIKNDNRLENLKLTNRSEHSKHHNSQRSPLIKKPKS